MGLSSIELWQKVAAEGLASPMQCRAWAAEAAKSMQAVDTTDGLKVLQQLIDVGRLTRYQAKILAGQSQEPLQRGPWHILQPVKDPLWRGWLEVVKIDTTKAEWPPASWVRWLQASEVEELQASAPTLPRGIQLAQVTQDHLQQVSIPELQNASSLQLQVAPLVGSHLTQVAHVPLAPGEALRIVEQSAQALAALHASGVVHGRVTPDRIYWNGQHATLANDPISAWTLTLDRQATGLIGTDLGSLQSEQFLAPEFIAPGQSPTMLTDVYALGCVWWWLLTGQPPAQGKTAQEILARQADRQPPVPEELDVPGPLRRVLQHCLARNPAARFSDAGMLLAALQRVPEVLKAGRSTPPIEVSVVEKASGPTDQPLRVRAGKSGSSPQAADPEPTSEPQAAQGEKLAQGKSVKYVDAQGETNQASPTQARDRGPAETGSRKKVETTHQPRRTAGDQAPSKVAKLAKQTRRADNVGGQPSGKVAESPIALEKQANTASKQSSSEDSRRQSVTNKQEAQTQASVRAESDPGSTTLPRGTNKAKPTKVGSGAATRRLTRKRRKNKWMLPVIGGLGFLIVVLIILQVSGALQPGKGKQTANQRPRPEYIPPSDSKGGPRVAARDPLLDHFQLVDSSETQLWAPPSPPQPIPLDLLPPGGGCFLSLRPSDMLSNPSRRRMLSTFDEQLGSRLSDLAVAAGEPLEQIEQVTVGFYAPTAAGSVPQWAMRVTLSQARSVAELRSAWQATSEQEVGDHKLLINEAGLAYFVAEQPLVSSQAVHSFSTGPVALMTEVAELAGQRAPLVAQVETLWDATSAEQDLVVLAAAPYLFTEGRGLLSQAPERIRDQLREQLGSDVRASLLQMQFAPQWYYEIQLVGASDREAGRLLAKLESLVTGAPLAIETWFVSQTAHPHWRALALRFPQMLRALAEQTRYGIEEGVAIANGYLPAVAAENILLSGWLAAQPAATISSLGAGTAVVPAAQPLTLEQYLNRKIELSFDQEPIEKALQLVGEAANEKLPSGTPRLRFELDGDAFELGGITRNQQLQDFAFVQQPMRDALTEIARRGNTVPNVNDTRAADQKLIWIVKEDPQNPGQQMISLTTRDAAGKAGVALPKEFAPMEE